MSARGDCAVEDCVNDCAEDCPERQRRRSAALLYPVRPHLIGCTSPRPVAAILAVLDGQTAVCWYNRRLVRGPRLGLVELWALRAIATGWHTSVLPESDLEKLT